MSLTSDSINAAVASLLALKQLNPTAPVNVSQLLTVCRLIDEVDDNDLASLQAQVTILNPSAGVLAADTVQEITSGHGVLISSLLARNGFYVTKPTPTAKNITATLTAAELLTGVITSTSVAAVSLTLPSIVSMVAILGNARGSYFDFVIDATLGANDVTVVLPASISQLVIVPDGGAGNLVVTHSATLGVGIFRLYFYSATAGVISRLA